MSDDFQEEMVRAFRHALLSRRFEERVTQLAMAGEVPATLHPGAGQEVCQAAAIAAMRDDDKVLYGHRGICYMVARGVPLTAILADIAGKEGGTNRGKGGVMHTVDPGRGVLGESGTLGGGFVVAAGVGMALKRFGRGQAVVHFFGDGTANRGTFHEALNWAALQRLPILFLCENNGWAVSVPTSVSTAVPDIAARAQGYGIPGVVVNGSEPASVNEAVGEALARARRGDGPTLIEAKVTRLLGHYIGDQQPYRESPPTSDADPLPKFQQWVVQQGFLTEKAIEEMEANFAAEIAQAVETVRAAPPLAPALALEDVYAGGR